MKRVTTIKGEKVSKLHQLKSGVGLTPHGGLQQELQPVCWPKSISTPSCSLFPPESLVHIKVTAEKLQDKI